jgi:hypothetical protein
MTADDLLERSLGPSKRLRDQTGFGDAVEIDLYVRRLCYSLRTMVERRCRTFLIS